VDKQDKNMHPVKQAVPVMLVVEPMEADEINLFELWHTLLRRKGLIAIFATITTCIGLLYALLATPIYQSQVILLPPAAKDIEKLQPTGILEGEINSSPDVVFKNFVENINSKSFRRNFVIHQGLLNTLAPNSKTEQDIRDAVNGFDSNLVYNNGTLILTGTDPKLIAEWLNDIVRMADEKTAENMVADFNSTLQHKVNALKQAISSRLAMAKQQRNDRKVHLKEALSIASSLGISDYRLTPSITSSKETDGKVSISSQDTPLYLRGTKSLQAELEALGRRKEGVAFIPGFRELQEKLFQLESQAIEPGNIHTMRLDEIAIAPRYQIKPKRKLIVLGSLLGGIVLGILVVFAIEASSRNRERKASASA